MAAEQGHVDAMSNLGTRYIQGQGVGHSKELAREWWTKAADEGDEGAIENLKLLDEQEGKSTTTAPTPTSPPPVCCSSCNTPQPGDRHFKNARAAARCSTATRSANERIGVQEGTSKSASD